jgi:hypothetical protein
MPRRNQVVVIRRHRGIAEGKGGGLAPLGSCPPTPTALRLLAQGWPRNEAYPGSRSNNHPTASRLWPPPSRARCTPLVEGNRVACSLHPHHSMLLASTNSGASFSRTYDRGSQPSHEGTASTLATPSASTHTDWDSQNEGGGIDFHNSGSSRSRVGSGICRHGHGSFHPSPTRCPAQSAHASRSGRSPTHRLRPALPHAHSTHPRNGRFFGIRTSCRCGKAADASAPPGLFPFPT